MFGQKILKIFGYVCSVVVVCADTVVVDYGLLSGVEKEQDKEY